MLAPTSSFDPYPTYTTTTDCPRHLSCCYTGSTAAAISSPTPTSAPGEPPVHATPSASTGLRLSCPVAVRPQHRVTFLLQLKVRMTKQGIDRQPVRTVAQGLDAKTAAKRVEAAAHEDMRQRCEELIAYRLSVDEERAAAARQDELHAAAARVRRVRGSA